MFHVRSDEDLATQRGGAKLQILVILVLLLSVTAVYVHRRNQAIRNKLDRGPKVKTPTVDQTESKAKVKAIQLIPIKSTKALPADTLAYFSFPDMKGLRTELKKSSMNQLYSEPAVQDFLADLQERLEEFRTQSQVRLGITIEVLQNILDGQITLAVLKPFKPGGSNRLVFMFDLCENRDRFKEAASTVISRLFPLPPAPEGQAPKEGQKTVRGKTIKIRNSVPTPLAYAYLDDTLVVSPSVDGVEEVINTLYAEEKAAPLAEAPAFKAVSERLAFGGDKTRAMICAYVSISNLLARYEDALGEARVESLRSGGLYGLKAFGYAAHFEGETKSPHRGVKETFFIYSPKAERQGFAAALLGWPKGEKTLLKLIPGDALSCSVTKMDPKGQWRSLLDAIRSFNREAGLHVEQLVNMLNRESGADLENDLLASLGDEILTYSVPEDPARNRKATIVTVLSLKDPAKAEQSLQKLLVGAFSLAGRGTPKATGEGEKPPTPAPQVQLRFDPTIYKDKRVQVLTTTGTKPLPFAPAYCIVDNRIVISNSAEGIRVALDTIESTGSLLVDAGDFKEVMGHLSAENSAIGYIDLKTGSRYVADRANQLGISSLQDLGLPVDLKRLPDVKVFQKHLFGVATCVVSDDEGLALESYSPLGSVGTIVGSALMAAPMLPGINVKDIFVRYMCKRHLEEMGAAMKGYANAHENRLPPVGSQHVELVTGGFAQKKVFYCPATGADPNSFPDAMGYQFTILDYSYEPVTMDVPVNPDTGQLNGMDHRLPIAWDKKGNHPDGRHVLFLDGHVEFLTEEAFFKMIENPKQ